jgi:hypothetical protein
MLVSNSASSSVVLTKSDSTSVTCDQLYVGGTGDVYIKHTSSGATVIYSAVPVGTILPVRLKDGRLMAATTATLITAMSN